MADELVFFSKRDCPLCDHGFPAAQRLAARHHLLLRKVDIETDPRWVEEYGERIPVLCFRDRVLGWGRLSERALERELGKVFPVERGPSDHDATLREAVAVYFETSGLPADGGYGDRLVRLRILGMPLAFPNTTARVRAVRYHDLHHVLTGYATDWMGEAQIGAWEVGSGCRGFFAAWILNLYAMSAGLALAPRRTFRAFLRGRRSSNLYGLPYGDALLDRKVGEVRRASGLEARGDRPRLDDGFAFAAWSLLSFALAILPLVLAGLGLWGLVRQILPAP